MNVLFPIKRGDTEPRLRATVKLAGVAVDLSAAVSATFLFKRSGAAVLQRTAVIEAPATAGVVYYDFVAADWGTGQFTFGSYSLECEIIFPASERLTVPTEGYCTAKVNRDLGDTAADA